MRLHNDCPICKKPLIITMKWTLDNSETIQLLKCNHVLLAENKQLLVSFFEYESRGTNKKAYDYQIEDLDFINSTNFNALIAHQMGLGKTITALLAARSLKKPTLVIVKSATLWQWWHQYKEWASQSLTGIFMIRDTKGYIPPGFDTYLISMDTFSRLVKVKTNPYGRVTETSIYPSLKVLPIEFVIVDECQSFKDTSSNRTQSLVAYIKSQNIEHKLFLSGTPIKNRADEYFTVLNLLDPDTFGSIEDFRRKWLVKDSKNRWSTVNPYRLEAFRELIAQQVRRKELCDVSYQLPEFRRTFETISIEDSKMKEIYNAELDRLRAKMGTKEKISYLDVSDSLMTLRRITGMAKVDFAVDYIDVFLDTVEQEKIAIGIHHHMVRDALHAKLVARNIKPIVISGEDNSDKKEFLKQEFQKPENRVLIINMLAGGVGMDGLQVCNNVICLERQWTSVDEEQFEARFHRNGQTRPVICEYMVAEKTIDSFFMDLVEAKRIIFGQTVTNEWSVYDDNLLSELIQRTSESYL